MTDAESSEHIEPVEIPEKPDYPRAIDEDVDDALEDAWESAKRAGNDYLERLLGCELASHRLQAGDAA